ncbi:MAG: hypothetical protein F9K24_03440 [Leptonema illini]|uniref:Uncharacterized protein n=1 Tax=Leptonema illini TaxID=183 RepID=A0A833M039_9LEPT|nr:MAG: hypothetical protein F9K24_03440 [Leptonema illini]
MGLIERIRNLIQGDLTSLFTDPSAGLWKAFLYLSFLAFVILLFTAQLLPDWSFPFRRVGPERSDPTVPGPVHNI